MIIWLITVLFISLIFAFSSQVRADSKALSLETTRFILSTSSAMDLIEHIQNTSKTKLVLEMDRFMRKLAHFCLFFVLGILFYAGFRQLFNKAGWAYLTAFGSGALIASLDEFHQSFIDGRGPLLSDVKIDIWAVAAALILIFFLQRTGRFLAKRYVCRHHKREDGEKC